MEKIGLFDASEVEKDILSHRTFLESSRAKRMRKLMFVEYDRPMTSKLKKNLKRRIARILDGKIARAKKFRQLPVWGAKAKRLGAISKKRAREIARLRVSAAWRRSLKMRGVLSPLYGEKHFQMRPYREKTTTRRRVS